MTNILIHKLYMKERKNKFKGKKIAKQKSFGYLHILTSFKKSQALNCPQTHIICISSIIIGVKRIFIEGYR